MRSSVRREIAWTMMQLYLDVLILFQQLKVSNGGTGMASHLLFKSAKLDDYI